MGKFFLPKATTAERTGLTPDDGTILYDETEQILYFGDGSTVGGNTLQGDVGPQGPPGTLTAVVDDTSPQLGGFLDPNGNFLGMDQGGDLTSASPLVIGTDGDYFNVTGTTGFAVMTVAANRFFVLQFDGALVVTHGASVVIPGGANFTTSSGDQLQCFSTAANIVRIVAITRANGTPVAINLVDDTSPQLGSFLDPNGNYVGSDKGGDLASASPLILGIDGGYFDVTGTTGFSSITVATNRRFRLQFDGVLAITVGAGITLNNNGANFTTAPGDIIDFQSVATNIVVGTITKADGTSPVSTSGGAWNLINSVEASNDTEITITGLDSTFDMYVILLSNIICTIDNSDLWLRVGDSGGIDSGVSDYGYHSADSNWVSTAYASNISSGQSRVHLADALGNANGEGLMGVLYMQRPTDSTTFPMVSGSITSRDNVNRLQTGPHGSIRLSSITLDRIQILFSSGNISSGRMSVYGIAHS